MESNTQTLLPTLVSGFEAACLKHPLREAKQPKKASASPTRWSSSPWLQTPEWEVLILLINFPLVLIFMGSISHCWKDVVAAPDPPTGREGWGHCSTGTEGLVEVLMWTGCRDKNFFLPQVCWKN